jgi:hypothetical protein
MFAGGRVGALIHGAPMLYVYSLVHSDGSVKPIEGGHPFSARIEYILIVSRVASTGKKGKFSSHSIMSQSIKPYLEGNIDLCCL